MEASQKSDTGSPVDYWRQGFVFFCLVACFVSFVVFVAVFVFLCFAFDFVFAISTLISGTK